MTRAARLAAIVRARPAVMTALRAARALGLPEWALGAGAIRNAVWDHLHGYARPSPPADLDLVYFDPAAAPEADARHQAQLDATAPGVAWEVVNQAHVHRWYRARLGIEAAPFADLGAALAAWPETATAVAVRLEADDALTVIAPLGLDDLFDLVLRPSPRCLDPTAFDTRLAAKGLTARWPRLRVARRRLYPGG